MAKDVSSSIQILLLGLLLLAVATVLVATGILVFIAIAGWFFPLSVILILTGYRQKKTGRNAKVEAPEV